jgi:hypothetical protein
LRVGACGASRYRRRVSEIRYRCDACGNLTRFDVTVTSTVRAYHHYSVGGELSVEEPSVLFQRVDSVECRWCGPGGAVKAVTPLA